ncbi:oocyte zinc finger protein XlCOF7.1-like [Hyperolius riggenbachi]|uniref:oocyte zinc finger protein XlCOF7.1-like n=1 Tax=Hyperolius riggenbachi TaxID=752182 RepID=UPI0035A38601
MNKVQSHRTEKILNLTLEIIHMLTGEVKRMLGASDDPKHTPDCKVAKGTSSEIMTPSSSLYGPSQMTAPPLNSLAPERNEKKLLDVIYKMIELLTGEEWQYTEGHKDLYKDNMMEIQPLLTSPGGSSDGNPPERFTGPLYSWDCPQEDPTSHHCQGEEVCDMKVEVKEEEDRTHVMGDLQSTEEGDMMGTNTEEEETYVRSDQRSMEEGDRMGIITEEEEETYMRSDHQSVEEGDMLRTSKAEEEETYVRRDHQSVEEGDMMRTFKEEEEETYLRSEQQSVEEGDMRTVKLESCSFDISTDGQNMGRPSEGCLISSPDDNGVTQCFPSAYPITGNTHYRLYYEERAPDPYNRDRSHPGGNSEERSHDPSHSEESLCKSRSFRHGGDKTFACPECDKCFTYKSLLLSHHKVHTNERPFSCSQCHKGFKRKGGLLVHQRSHTGERPFSCPACRKCFTLKSSLLMHQNRYMGKCAFFCSECRKGFSSKRTFLIHQRRHTVKYPFSCSECGKGFEYKGHLLNHHRTHTGERPFSCSECGKCFIQKSGLMTHKKRNGH